MASTHWLTPPKVAEQFGVAVHKIHQWISSGELVAVNVATSTSSRPVWRISDESLRAFIESRQAQPPVPKPASSRRTTGGKRYV
jgi:predicted site-specific integrase-resolvase